MHDPGRGSPGPPSSAGSRGLVTCLLVAGAILGLGSLCVCAGLGVGAFMASRDPEMRRAVGRVGEAIEITQAAQDDPGAVALRSLGCMQAFAMESRAVVDLFLRPDAGPEPPTDEAKEGPQWTVTCVVRAGRAVDVDAMARAFAEAHRPPVEDFLLLVQRQGEGEPLHMEVHGPRGERLDPGESPQAAPTPLPGALSAP